MKLEIREGQINLTGYVNVTARDSRPIPSPQGAFIEQVMPGTFQKALDRNPNVRMCFDHGRTVCDQSSGLELREDSIGLYADATFSDAEIEEKARAGQLTGWSFGFYVNSDHWSEDKQRRYLDDIDLEEISVLDCTPAYIATSVEARSDAAYEVREAEELTVDADEKKEPEPDTDPDPEPEAKEKPDQRARAKAIVYYYDHR